MSSLQMEVIRRQSDQVDQLQHELDQLRNDDTAKTSQIRELSTKVEQLTKEVSFSLKIQLIVLLFYCCFFFFFLFFF